MHCKGDVEGIFAFQSGALAQATTNTNFCDPWNSRDGCPFTRRPKAFVNVSRCKQLMRKAWIRLVVPAVVFSLRHWRTVQLCTEAKVAARLSVNCVFVYIDVKNRWLHCIKPVKFHRFKVEWLHSAETGKDDADVFEIYWKSTARSNYSTL